MHHHHQAMCNSLCAPYSSVPYNNNNNYQHHHRHHHGAPIFPPYELMDPVPVPIMNNFVPRYYHDYSCRRNVPHIDHSYCDYIPPRPVIQTNIHNDVCYYVDDSYDEYDDEYEDSYRLSRSRIQLVDLVPKTKPRRKTNRMVVSTFQPRVRDTSERIIIPRSTVVRAHRNPSYERQRHNMKLVPLNRSSEPQYRISSRRRPVARAMVPIASEQYSYYPQRQTIRVRTLSPS